MKLWKIVISSLMILTLAVSTSACRKSSSNSADAISTLLKGYQQDNQSLTFNNHAWHFDEINHIYWQIGVGYCFKPETTTYETMAIYVPSAYMSAAANGDGTFTCTVDPQSKINGYTAQTAPIVMPVNTPGYSAQASPTTYDYNSVSNYMNAGFVYVCAGMRGRNNGYDSNGQLIYSGGAPWGVTDLKAAVRYYRFNQNNLPGNPEKIFTFGHSGGGAQSAVMGASGDSPLYIPYLKAIGAAMTDTNGRYISDATCGAMCWCPITSLDYADEGYEWNMGQYSSSGTRTPNTWTSALSKDLANAYASYINQLGLKSASGTVLTLAKTDTGIYTAGSYYEYIKSIIEGSLNNFLNDTKFPYTKSAGGGLPGGNAPPGMLPGGTPPGGDAGPMGVPPTLTDKTSSITYQTAQDYINALNADGNWIVYNRGTNTAIITSIGAFVQHCKNASKDVPAFDSIKRSQAENYVFGNDASDALHFDFTVADLLQQNKTTYASYSDWDPAVLQAYLNDLQAVDKIGNGTKYRQNMYNPMYYLGSHYEGYKTSTPALYWRIRTGIEQGDTASTVEANLALALKDYPGLKGVDFETVWGQGHTMAERSGDSTSNFINWVNQCTGQ